MQLVERYDEKMMYYKAIMGKMDGASSYHPVNCVQLCLGTMLTGIKSHAKEWLTMFGDLLLEIAKSRLLLATTYIQVCDYLPFTYLGWRAPLR